MEEYYIRTPNHDDARGPFDVDKLQTLFAAGQINAETIYYDQEKEAWLPIADNEALKAAIFPVKKTLGLKIAPAKSELSKAAEDDSLPKEESVDLSKILAAADGETVENQQVKRSRESVERTAMTAPTGLAVVLLLSAVSLLYPLLPTLSAAFSDSAFLALLGYPFLLIGLLDLLLAIALGLGVTEVYNYVRGRAMLTFGFGLYVGWALQAPEIMLAFSVAGIATFAATLARRFEVLIPALVFAAGTHLFLVYLAITGRFSDFFEMVRIPLGL